VPQRGYITDELTDYAVDWLNGRTSSKPFFLYLSHKAVHSDFIPAERHKGTLASPRLEPPASQTFTPDQEAIHGHGVQPVLHEHLDPAYRL